MGLLVATQATLGRPVVMDYNGNNLSNNQSVQNPTLIVSLSLFVVAVDRHR